MSARFLCVLILLSSSTLISSGNARGACSTTTGVPCPANSVIPCGINLVGSAGGSADVLGTFTVRVVDGNNADILGADVWLDFQQCCNDIRLSSTQLGPGVSLGSGKTVHATSVTGGIATFVIMGGAAALAASPASGCAEVWAQKIGAAVKLSDGTPSHALVQVGVYDLNGATGGGAGVGPADLGVWVADYWAGTTGPYLARGDYDFNVLCTQNLGAADLARWLTLFFAAGSAGNGPAFLTCP